MGGGTPIMAFGNIMVSSIGAMKKAKGSSSRKLYLIDVAADLADVEIFNVGKAWILVGRRTIFRVCCAETKLLNL
jgi:hypothetical protein